MENFIVSARKYRPTTFDTVVGQESITNTLKNAIRTNHLSQAYLFCGPRGVGKTTCARILAKTINCQDLSAGIEACDKCESCLSFNSSRSFNIHELDAASNNKVDDIRTLTDQVRIPPQVGRYSIYIIDEVHMLSTSAFNAFLKTLEEPPPHAIFILATTEKQKIIPTILSRCQIFDFNRISVDDIVSRLTFVAGNEKVMTEQEALHIIALKSDGAMRDALSIFDQIVSYSGKNVTYSNVIENLNVLDYDYYLRITDAFMKADLSTSFLIFNEILEKGFDGHNFIAGLASHFRNLMVSKDPGTVKLMEVGKSIKERYLEQTGRTPLPFLYRGLDILSNCDVNYRLSRNQRLHVELALVKLCSLAQPVTESEEPSSPLKEMEKAREKKVEEPGPPPEKRSREAEPTPKVTEKVEGDKASGSFSIKENLSTFEKEESSLEEKGEEYPDEGAEVDNVFGADELIAAWKRFGAKVESPRMASIIQAMVPALSEGGNITLSLSNEAQKEYFDKKYKADMVEFLQKELNSRSIDLITSVKEETGNSAPYTEEEKYKHLVNKNPALDLLKKDFKLDFE